MAESILRYSEAFKLQVLSELESGKLRSQAEAREKYGITGAATVAKWLRKYGKRHLMARIVRVEKPGERDEVKALKGRIRELERALADAKVQEVVHRAYFEIVCEKAGVTDPEALKKSIDERRWREDRDGGRDPR
jgi:transposase-like protein